MRRCWRRRPTAASGRRKGVATQVDRLLQTDAVKQNIDNVVVSWFNVPQLVIKTKDPSLIPDAVTAMVPAGQDVQATLESDILTSTTDFVDDVVWKGSGRVTELLTSNKLFVNQRLAALYGLPYGNGAGARPDGFVGVARSAAARRHDHPARLHLVAVRSGDDVDRPPRQRDPRLRRLRQRAEAAAARPAQLAGDHPAARDAADRARQGELSPGRRVLLQLPPEHGQLRPDAGEAGSGRQPPHDVRRGGQRSGSDHRDRRLLEVPQGGAAQHADHRAGGVRARRSSTTTSSPTARR